MSNDEQYEKSLEQANACVIWKLRSPVVDRHFFDAGIAYAEQHSRPRIPRELWERAREYSRGDYVLWTTKARELIKKLLEHVQPEDGEDGNV